MKFTQLVIVNGDRVTEVEYQDERHANIAHNELRGCLIRLGHPCVTDVITAAAWITRFVMEDGTRTTISTTAKAEAPV